MTILRPVVRAPAVCRERKPEGYGFTSTEPKEAGICRKEDRGVGTIIDRNRDLSEGSPYRDAETLEACKAQFIVPLKAGKPKEGNSAVRSPSSDDFDIAQICIGDDPKAPATVLTWFSTLTAQMPHKIAEECSFDAAGTLHDAKFRAVKVVPYNDLPWPELLVDLSLG